MPLFASPPTASWSPNGEHFHPKDGAPTASSRRMAPSTVDDTALPPLRRERHVSNSIVTLRRRLTAAFPKTLSRCTCCLAPPDIAHSSDAYEAVKFGRVAKLGEKRQACLATDTRAGLAPLAAVADDDLDRLGETHKGRHGRRQEARGSMPAGLDPDARKATLGANANCHFSSQSRAAIMNT